MTGFVTSGTANRLRRVTARNGYLLAALLAAVTFTIRAQMRKYPAERWSEQLPMLRAPWCRTSRWKPRIRRRASRSATTSTGAGEYRIGSLLPGTYAVNASAAGFAGTTLQNVVIDANKIETQNITLSVGQVATNVEVTESVVNIDTTTATIQNTFDQQMVRDLPVTSIGLGFANLALLNAGVSGNGGIGAGEGPSVGGQRPYNNNFMIEGVDTNNKSVTGSLIRTIPNDAVAEFTVLQNQESAQYGHSSGGQFNTILKSGGNAFHGTVYEYLQNRNLNAIDQQVQNRRCGGREAEQSAFGFQPFRRLDRRSDQRNKLFFFGDYEHNPVGASATPASVAAPTAAGITALSAIPGIERRLTLDLQEVCTGGTTADPNCTETCWRGDSGRALQSRFAEFPEQSGAR